MIGRPTIHLMMVKIAKEKALPFEPLVPNEETIEAMKAARRGELTSVPFGEAAPEPEYGLLNTPAAFAAITGARNPDGRPSASMSCFSKPSPSWQRTSHCRDGIRSSARRRVERSPRLPHPIRPHSDLSKAG
jgi:hypothetical protein